MADNLHAIFVCDDVLYDVFAFCGHFTLGLAVALVNNRHDMLVDKHLNTTKWALGQLEICRARYGAGPEIIKRVDYAVERKLKIPTIALPAKVVGFERLTISYIDQSVIEFLARIGRLFVSNELHVLIDMWTNTIRVWEVILGHIWPLINQNICGFEAALVTFLCLRHFSPTLLTNCAKLRLVDLLGTFPEFPPDDTAAASSRQAMAKWLQTARADGLPKVLKCGSRWTTDQFEDLKQAFLRALDSARWIIFVTGFEQVAAFKLENNWTREQLVLRPFDSYNWALVRCPIERDEEKWAQWEKEAAEWNWGVQFNSIHINLNERRVGDNLLRDPNEGPSAPKKRKNVEAKRIFGWALGLGN